MKELYNIKMRASKWNKSKNEFKHISGAERISQENFLEDIVKNLVDRAISHEKGKSDSINISINKIDKNKIKYIPCLDITTIQCNSPDDGRIHICEILKKINLEHTKVVEILNILASNCDMTGAILFDVSTMKRIDQNNKKGIRATGMDWKENLKNELKETLESHGLNNNHVKEALVLASKVIYPKGALSEICISDDPNYTTGYVSVKNHGYFRITNLKELGSQKGGRIILFDSRHADVDEYIDFLENTITIVNKVPKVN